MAERRPATDLAVALCATASARCLRTPRHGAGWFDARMLGRRATACADSAWSSVLTPERTQREQECDRRIPPRADEELRTVPPRPAT